MAILEIIGRSPRWAGTGIGTTAHLMLDERKGSRHLGHGPRPPHWRPIALLKRGPSTNEPSMPDRQQTLAKVLELIAPFNKKGVAITAATRFAQDLEWDSLTVLDFVANIEDEFDVLISMNMQAEIETVGQLVDALQRLKA
jgi:acyl carrier protein